MRPQENQEKAERAVSHGEYQNQEESTLHRIPRSKDVAMSIGMK